jgi:hypothetical protein
MQPHPRIRKTIKWGGAVITVLLVVVWIGSGWLGVDWTAFDGTTKTDVAFQTGAFVVSEYKLPSRMLNYMQVRAPGFSFPQPGFSTYAIADARWEWGFSEGSYGGVWQLSIPIWPLVLVIGLATVTSWRFDTLARRRAKLNLCPNCGYDRTGLAIGAACPECGTGSTSG